MITEFKLFESQFDELEKICNKKIIEIIRKSGYITHFHSNIYKTTIEGKDNLISTVYGSYKEKYGDIVFLNTYSFFKNDFDPANYGDEYFVFPLSYLQKLKDGEAFKHQVLPFYDELFDVLEYYNKQKTIKKFKI